LAYGAKSLRRPALALFSLDVLPTQGASSPLGRTTTMRVRILLLGLLAIAVSAAAPGVAHAVNTCNGLITIDYVAGPDFALPGDVVRVKLTLGTGSIQGGTKLNVNRLRFDLDCDNNFTSTGQQSSSIPLCPDCNDNIECSQDMCDQSTGMCSHTPVADSTPCTDTDNNACTTAGCNGTLATGGSVTDGCDQNHMVKTCTDDTNPCTGPPTCNPQTGNCDFPNVPDSTPCPDTDSNACTTARHDHHHPPGLRPDRARGLRRHDRQRLQRAHRLRRSRLRAVQVRRWDAGPPPLHDAEATDGLYQRWRRVPLPDHPEGPHGHQVRTGRGGSRPVHVARARDDHGTREGGRLGGRVAAEERGGARRQRRCACW